MFHNWRELMKKPVLMLLPFVLALTCGCTPSSEDIARKADANTLSKEDIGSAVGSAQNAPQLLDAATERCIRNYGPTIKMYSGRYGFDWRLVLAIMKQESRFSRGAESHKGAAGLMQLMPVTGEELARRLDLDDLSHPDHNIQAGIFYLRKLYDLFEGSEDADRLKRLIPAWETGRVGGGQRRTPTSFEAILHAAQERLGAGQAEIGLVRQCRADTQVRRLGDGLLRRLQAGVELKDWISLNLFAPPLQGSSMAHATTVVQIPSL